MAWDWDEIFNAAGKVVVNAALAKVALEWLEQPLNDALIDVENYVNRTPVSLLDEMDVFLLNMGQNIFYPEAKRQFLKIYAYFKVTEFNAYRKFRGFPE
jgi:hypothetical protein